MFYSCNKKSNSSGYSQDFQPVVDTVSYLFELNKPNIGIHYLDSSVQQLSNLTPTDKFRIYSFHFAAATREKHGDKALLYADSMLMSIKPMTNKNAYMPLYGEAKFAKGDALFELGHYNEAFNSYYQGYLTGKNSLNNCTLSDYTYRMGMITYKEGNYNSSADYFKESFEQCTSCKEEFTSFFRQQEVLDNIALCYKNTGQLHIALIYFNKALNYIDKHSKDYQSRHEILEVARAVIYGNKADVLSKQGLYAPAIALLKKSIATNIKKGNDNHDAQISEIKLGKLYLQLNKEDLLLPLLSQLKGQIDSSKNTDIEADWNMLLGSYYKTKKQFDKALNHLERFHYIQDSLAETASTLKLNNVNEQVSNIEKQYQIVELRNKQRVYIFTGIIFLSMLLIIIMLIYRNWKRSRSEMAIVSTLNTQINKQKTDLENTLIELNVRNQEKDRILHTVAHDLRNPLGGIASLTSVMVEDSGYNAEQIELLKIIKDTAYDSIGLINEILEATDSSKSELSKQLVDINVLLNNSVELMRFKAAEKNQRIILKPLSLSQQILINREKIWRVISNLISNAIKFSPVGSAIEVDIIDKKDKIQVCVTDHGIGIPENLKPKVFNMFTEAKRPGTLGEKSFGLGLSICRQIIENHGGKIWFESNTQGTTFFICLLKNNVTANPKSVV